MPRTKGAKNKVHFLDKEGNTKRKKTAEVAAEDVTMEDNANKTYVTLKLKFNTATDFLKCLRDKYKTFLMTLQLADPTVKLYPVNPDRTDLDPLCTPASLPDRMTGLAPFLSTSSRVNKKKAFSYWVNAKIGHDLDWEELADVTSFDLQEININLMKKRLQCYKTACPAYLLFINNQTDPDHLVSDISADLPAQYNWTLFNKKPWECNYEEKKRSDTKEDRQVESYSRFPHVEVDINQEDKLLKDLRQWVNSGTARARFGPHVKLVTCLDSKSPPTQVERTIRMNEHGRRFQASVSMVELEGLTNPNGVITKKGPAVTVRDLLLHLTTKDQKPIFLSVTKKWNSSNWQGTYILREQRTATDIATCPCAWIKRQLKAAQLPALYKHFTPSSGVEADGATWDEENHRVVTPAEAQANQEESEVANISWLVDLSSLEPLDESKEVEFQDGTAFNFDGELSIKTTRSTTSNQDDDDDASHHSHTSKPASILRSAGTSVTSDMTENTRIDDLECSLARLDTKFDSLIQALTGKSKPSSSAQGDGEDP